jgi:hypothetical protein
MKNREPRAICIPMRLVLASCALPEAGRSPSPAPARTATPPLSPGPRTSPLPAPAETDTAQLLIDRAGDRYFRDHYRLEQEEVVGRDLIKAAYRYP